MNKHYIKQILTIVLLSLLSLSASAREVVIPEGTKVVTSDDGYRGDTTITSVVFPKSLQEIEADAFSGCSSLTEILFSYNLNKIGSDAFWGTNLTKVTCYSINPPQVGSYYYDSWFGGGFYINSFPEDLQNCTLYVLPECIEKYKSSSEWGSMGEVLPIETPITYIRDTITVCSNELPIEWRGRHVEESQIIVWGATAKADSVATLCLKENRAKQTILYDTLAYGEKSYMWHGRELSGRGVYTDTLTTVMGCDSVVTLNLKQYYDLIIPDGTTTISRNDRYCNDEFIISVSIPNSVTSIGDYAFSGCKNLKDIEIPNSVKSIGYGAFKGCASISQINIPLGVTSIENFTFSGCSNLTDVVIPNSVTVIDGGAFEECKNLKDIAIPNSVTRIGWSAFSGCIRLGKLVIPYSVSQIDTFAFDRCTNLSRMVSYAVTPPDGLWSYESIADTLYVPSQSLDLYKRSWDRLFETIMPMDINAVFYRDTLFVCNNELPVKWHDKQIYDDEAIAWGDGPSPDTVQSVHLVIGKSYRITKHDTLAYGEKSYMWNGRELPGRGVYTDTLTTVMGCDSVVTLNLKQYYDLIIPEGTTTISPNDRYYNDEFIISVSIPNSVTTIGSSAFSGCKNLTDIEIPNSVISIGDYAFSGCENLEELIIPNSVTMSSMAFSLWGCKSLKKIVLPNSVTNIEDTFAFQGCPNLSQVVCYAIEPPVGYDMFSDETLNGTLYVPSQSMEAYRADKNWGRFATILPIAEDAPVSITQTLTVCENNLPVVWREHEIYGDTVLSFNDTLWYMSLRVRRPVVVEMYDTISCGASYKDFGFTIKNPVSGIYTDSLSTAEGCDSVVVLHLEVDGELVIPEGTKEITYEDGYHGNKCITSVKIPNSVTEIGPDAFYGCTGLTSVEIPNSVTSLSGFSGCTGLTSVEIPNSVTKIDSFVFDGCTGLTSVKIPNSVEYVERGAFAGCVGLTSVELPNSVMMIGQEAFSHCISLTSVEIPNSVTEIGKYAFSGCTSLSKVVCYAVEPPAYYSSYYYHVFSDETLKGTLYVPAKSIDDYKSSKLWGQFSTILPIEGSELPTVTIDEMIPVCEHDLPIMWRGHEIYQSDTTFLVSSALSDTLYYIHLDIHASSITKLTAEVKKGEGYELGDSVYYQPGVYDQIYVSAMGCDSIIRLSLSYVEEADTIPNVSDGTAVANLLTTLPDGTNVYYANGLLFKVEKGELLPVMYDSVYAVVGDSVLPQNDSIFIPCSVMIEGKSYDVKSVDMDAACGKMKIETYYSWSYQYKMLDYLKVPDCVEYLNTGYYKWGMNWRSVFDITPNPNLKLEYDSNSVQIYWHDNDALDLMRRDFVNNSYYGVDFYLDDSLLTLIVPDGVDKLRNYHIHNSFDTIVLPNNDLMVGRDSRSFFTYNCNFLSLSNALVDDESQDYFYGGTLITTDVLNLRDWKAWCETSTSDYVTYKKILYQGQEIGNDLLLGEGIQSISTNSFKKFDFNSIYLPSTMTTIEKNAFAKLDLQSLSLSRNIDLSATGIQSADTLFFRGTMAEWCADPVVSIPYNVLVIEGQVYDKNTKSLFVAEGVELIHSQAFSICPNIRTLVLPSTLTEISDGAFKSCISLTTVTCYAPEPPVALGSTFGNYNGYLYIPCDYRPDYDIHVCWGSFKHVECITAESTVVDDVVVEPDHVSADISWPKIDGVVGYTIDISLNGKVILTLNFNEDGQLVNIDFSKALQSVKPAPSQTYALTSLRSAVEGFRFSVTGLEEATTYQYTLKVLGDAGKVIESHSGEFTTLGESNGVEEKPAEMDDFSISVENGIVMVSVDVSIPVSFYNLQGQCLFNHMGSCAFRAPYTGVYVVRCGVKAIKVLVR